MSESGQGSAQPPQPHSVGEVFAPRCLSIDLEVGRQDGRIHRFAAVRGDSDAVLNHAGGALAGALARLDALTAGAAFVLGHNLVLFDLPHLAAVKPDLALLSLPAVDTLWLNPLAFPRNPYHHLVKHYQDGQLQREKRNDPELDARLALELLRDQHAALSRLKDEAPERLALWHWLTTRDNGISGMNAFFMTLRRQPRPSDVQAMALIAAQLSGVACRTATAALMTALRQGGSDLAWPLAYALAWLSAAGGNSVMPPWVRHQFPETGRLLTRLRDQACTDPACLWCRERHDACQELRRWFGFDAFRPEPVDQTSGKPLQQLIVESALAGDSVLGILPTGTGKSVCYQIPALSRFDKTGALTVVVSPLVALMEDQVTGLFAKGITSCVAVNGMLSMPERRDALDRIRLGDAAMVILSPEQLRTSAVRKVLKQREIGAWVLDEAHCLSKWGHDFRPDYRYVSRFIKEWAGDQPVPPILCLTATAKPDVVAEIREHFRQKLGVDLKLLDGGAKRDNLDFSVVPTSPAEKMGHVHQLLESGLPLEQAGGAIVYCASRRNTEEIAEFLRQKGWTADHFHAGLAPERKKSVQKSFIAGELRVMVATNAFGMGIDKPDVRLVIHADIPGSLENYLQEAGRAGRDREFARCVLLYTREDVERQFGLSARSRLSQREIQAILKSLRRMDKRKRGGGQVVATAGEILAEEEDHIFQRDSASDDTRVRTAISWLEEACLLQRDENRVQVFPSSLRVASVAEAEKRLKKRGLSFEQSAPLLALIKAIMAADADDGLSTDELMLAAGLDADGVRAALYDLEQLGLASNDTALTAFVHLGVERASSRRLEQAVALENALIAAMRETAPELDSGEQSALHLRHACQKLKDAGHTTALPEKLVRILKSLTEDGRNEDDAKGSLNLKRLDPDTVAVRLNRPWAGLSKRAELRHQAGQLLVRHLVSCLPEGSRGVDLLAETSLGELRRALDGDLLLKQSVKDSSRLLDRSLLWLHEQEVIRLNKGLAVFRPAMTLRLEPGNQRFNKADFAPLQVHYEEQVLQIHVMAEYVQRGLHAMAEALRLAMDYFALDQDSFLRRWLPGRDQELARQTTPESWSLIVDSLANRAQQAIVADDRQQVNVLVLAGPGSGKTRVLVHRIAYLVRCRREAPGGILALAYNRHAAVEIRRRLRELIGDDAKAVTVLTCDALAMRLTGASFVGREKQGDDDRQFDAAMKAVRQEATALLRGQGLPPDEADEQRARLLAGFRWILVDEYQDIGPEQYELIAALAGRGSGDDEVKLNLFAVGDDDQNIYAFNGASVSFIRRFEADYAAKPAYLVENYRSSGHIIAAANRVIEAAAERMKADQAIRINHRRKADAPCGPWQRLDPVAQGRVQVLQVENAQHQAQAVITELQRLASLDSAWDWRRVAVIARNWSDLEPLRAWCRRLDLPVQWGKEELPFWRLRETRALVTRLKAEHVTLTVADLRQAVSSLPANRYTELLTQAADEYELDTAGAELPLRHALDWLAEWGRDYRRRQNALLLTTAHGAKGLEFDHVAVLDGEWHAADLDDTRPGAEDSDAPRRLFYVAMTRARFNLILALRLGRLNRPGLLQGLHSAPCIMVRPAPAPSSTSLDLGQRYQRLTPADVFLDFAGQKPAHDDVHAAIAALQPGDALRLVPAGKYWLFLDSQGRAVARSASKFQAEGDMAHARAQVSAILAREREDASPEYLDRLACTQWEVVLPELIFPGRNLK